MTTSQPCVTWNTAAWDTSHLIYLLSSSRNRPAQGHLWRRQKCIELATQSATIAGMGGCKSGHESVQRCRPPLPFGIRLLAGGVLFLTLRGFLVPRSFGQYGHYRGSAIKETAWLPISYAGHQVCEGCHVDILEVKSKGVHKGVACEGCHGPLAKHADDPASVQPAKLDTAAASSDCPRRRAPRIRLRRPAPAAATPCLPAPNPRHRPA